MGKNNESAKNIGIYGNGNLSKSHLLQASNYDYVIATDISALKLIGAGMIPDLAIGDFDSISAKEFSYIKNKISDIKIFSSVKNFTDIELAIKSAVKLRPENIDIYASTGTRLDHTLASIYLLNFIHSKGVKAKIIDDYNEISLVDDKINLSKSPHYTFFSVIPVSKSAVITIEGAKYDLKNKKIFQGQTIGISNEIEKGNCLISVRGGKIILIRSRD